MKLFERVDGLLVGGSVEVAVFGHVWSCVGKFLSTSSKRRQKGLPKTLWEGTGRRTFVENSTNEKMRIKGFFLFLFFFVIVLFLFFFFLVSDIDDHKDLCESIFVCAHFHVAVRDSLVVWETGEDESQND